MKAEIKTIASIDGGKQRILIAKIRSEHEIIFSPNSLNTIHQAISKLEEGEQDEDKVHFAWELRRLVTLYSKFAESPAEVIGELQSEWKPITGTLTLETLAELNSSTENLKSIRFEGSVDSNFRLVMQSGTEIQEISATRERLTKIRYEIEEIKTLPEFQAASVAEWIIAVGIAVEAGLMAWDRWDKEQERRRQNDEKKRQEEENARRESEGNAHEPCHTSAGGPAHDDMMDRISRTA
jgi:hypothetical protein